MRCRFWDTPNTQNNHVVNVFESRTLNFFEGRAPTVGEAGRDHLPCRTVCFCIDYFGLGRYLVLQDFLLGAKTRLKLKLKPYTLSKVDFMPQMPSMKGSLGPSSVESCRGPFVRRSY